MLSGMSTRRKAHDPGLVVIVAANATIADVNLGGTSHAWIQIDSDGSIYESKTDETPTVFREVWLDSGLNSQVWVIATFTGDTPSAGSSTTSVRHACTADRKWGLTAVNPNNLACTLTLNFWDAASGGNNLDTQVVSMSADTS